MGRVLYYTKEEQGGKGKNNPSKCGEASKILRFADALNQTSLASKIHIDMVDILAILLLGKRYALEYEEPNDLDNQSGSDQLILQCHVTVPEDPWPCTFKFI